MGQRSWTWPQREAVRIATIRGEIRRADLMTRCGISTESARRDLVAPVEREVMKRLGHGRGDRYILRLERSSASAEEARSSARHEAQRRAGKSATKRNVSGSGERRFAFGRMGAHRNLPPRVDEPMLRIGGTRLAPIARIWMSRVLTRTKRSAPKTALRAGCYRRIKRPGTSDSGVGGPSAAWS
jgi:hypothetical protein